MVKEDPINFSIQHSKVNHSAEFVSVLDKNVHTQRIESKVRCSTIYYDFNPSQVDTQYTVVK